MSKRRPIKISFRKICGFTMIEILVVVSIIAILVIFMLPAVNKFLASAHSAKCQFNLKSIGQGMNMYASDNNGYFPPHWGSTTDSRWKNSEAFDTDYKGSITWYGFIAPYITSWSGDITQQMDEVFRCPASRKNSLKGKTYISNAENGQDQSYAYNYYLLTHNYALQAVQRRQMVMKPSLVVLACDRPVGSTDIGMSMPLSHSSFTPYPGGRVGMCHPHDSANVVFMDGHVENVHTEDFLTPGKNFNPANWDPRLAK